MFDSFYIHLDQRKALPHGSETLGSFILLYAYKQCTFTQWSFFHSPKLLCVYMFVCMRNDHVCAGAFRHEERMSDLLAVLVVVS